MNRPRTGAAGALAAIFAYAAAGQLFIGCAAPSRTTRLETRDFEDIAFEVAQSLRASDFLRERSPDSAPMTVAIQKAENLSSDILSEGERWFLMNRVVQASSMRALADERAIRFVIPAENLRELRELTGDDQLAAGRAPTHTMTARLRSITRAAGLDRTDLYRAEYRITDLSTGETMWTGEFELKRAAVGRSYF